MKQFSGDVINVQSMTVTDDKGNPNYPIDIHKPMVLHAVSQLGGSTTYKTMWEDVKMSYWGGFLGCSWHTFPTFGLL